MQVDTTRSEALWCLDSAGIGAAPFMQFEVVERIPGGWPWMPAARRCAACVSHAGQAGPHLPGLVGPRCLRHPM